MSALGAVEDIEVLEARGLIRFHVDGRRREVRLAHPVHGEVVRNTLPALRAMAIERRLSEAVRASGARRRDDRMPRCRVGARVGKLHRTRRAR